MAKAVRFWNPGKEFDELQHEMMPVITDVLRAGDLVMRQQMLDFEQNLAKFVGTNDAVGVSNCTDGLRLTLEALGIGAGNEVITVAHTFVATMAAIHHVGATPILVDVGDDFNMDVDLVEAAITPRTRAVMPVHLNGRLCRMDQLMAVCEKHSLLVVEDTAQALGASYAGVPGGKWGVAGAFSFYPAKMLGALGDAGAVVTDDTGLASRLRALRDHGRVSKTELNGWGWNCRLDNMQAAVLDFKLRKIPGWIARRRHLASLYDEALAGVAGVERPQPPAVGRYFDVFQNYVIRAERRDALVKFLADRGIETLLSWSVPMHHQPLGLDHHHLPRTETFADRVVSLPMHNVLEDDEAVHIAGTIKEFYA